MSFATNDDVEAQRKRNLVRAGDAYRLLPHHPIYVTVCAGDGTRFVRLFREVWARTPLAVRRRMLAHWRSGSIDGKLVPLSTPRCEIYASGGDWLGRVALGGRLIKFAADGIERLPDAAVRDLIAHELAHVAQWSYGWMDQWYEWARDAADHDDMVYQIEEEADEIADRWGFSGEALRRWKWEQRQRAQVAQVGAA